VHFRSQVTFIPEATLLRIVGSYYGLQKKLLSLSSTFPSLAISSRFFNNDTNPYVYLCQRLISRLLAWISLFSSGSIHSDWIIITFRTLQRALKWPSSLDKISDFSKWNSSRRSIHHHWIFQSLRILLESGLSLILPDGLCLDLMPSQSVPLVSISVELANSEKATWLFSKFWCLSQLFDPFHQFLYTWMDLKRMNLVSKTGKTPSWFTRLISLPDLPSLLPTPNRSAPYPPSLLTLQGTALDTIDEQSRIKARNRYYWIAGLDGSDTMIFGRVFYTVDVHDTRIVYFSHWITSSSDRFKLSPCQGCSLHDATIENGPLQVRSVGSNLSHRSCLTFLPVYRCLQLFHMSSRIDSTCNNINLFLSPFLLCSFFKILLGYSCVRIPELFLVDSSYSSLPTDAMVSHKLPDVLPNFDPDLRINTEQHIYLHARSSIPKPMSSNDIVCGWVQRDDDLILSSGSFSWTNGPVSPHSSELGYILRILQLLPRHSSVNFYSTRSYNSMFSSFQRSSAERRVRLPYYVLWMAISICIQDLQINCQFHTVPDMAADAYLSRCLTLSGLLNADDPTPSFITLLKFPSLQRLSINLLCNGIPLTMDPVHFWRDFSDMHEFFRLLNLSRFIPLRSSYSWIDWRLTFDLIKDTLYHRLDVSRISASYRFRLQLWFDELPLMSRLRFRYPGLYADDSLCPNCGIFMETLEHFFTCLPDSLSIIDHASPPVSTRTKLIDLLDQFVRRLAKKASASPKARLDFNSLLLQLQSLPTIGLASLRNYSDHLTFTGLWFLRGFIPRDLSSLIMSSSGLSRRDSSNIIIRYFLKLHREIYHQLWRPRCKMKSLKDKAMDVTPALLRTIKSSDFTNFRYDTSP
ncbi:hypothetical protein RhiirA4_431746, partial [Rhizophagus irregularis]